MKIKLLLFAVSGLLSLQMHGQHNPRNPIVTGIKGGLNLSNISAGKRSQDMKPSFHLGATVEFPLSYYKKYALQIELMYSDQGYKGKEIEKRDELSGELIEKNKLDNVSLHYLNVPVLFKYYVQDQFSFEIGPQIGFLMGANGEFDLYKYNAAREYLMNYPTFLDQELDKYGYRDNNYKNFYDTLDYGLAFGLSYNFNNGMFLSGRYYLGLKDIYKADNGFVKLPITEGLPESFVNEINRINKEIDPKSVKNSVIQVSIGYRF